TISIRAWYVQSGRMAEKAAVQDTTKIFFGLLLVAFAFRSELIIFYNHLNKPIAVFSAIVLMMYIFRIFINFSSELSVQEEVVSFSSTKNMLSGLIFLAIIVSTTNIVFLPEETVLSKELIYTFYVLSLLSGFYVGKVSGRMFPISKWFFKKSNILQQVLFLVIAYLFFTPLFPCMLFYFGLMVHSIKRKYTV